MSQVEPQLPPESPATPTPTPTAPAPGAPWASGERGSRANNFDLLRLAMAVLVIVSHAWPIVAMQSDPRPQAGEPMTRWTGYQASLGELCVQGFFIVSGYLITASWVHSRSLGDYLRKRVLRIYPAFVLAFLVSLGIEWGTSPQADIGVRSVGRHAARLVLLQFPNVTRAMPHNPLPGVVNGSVWTIQYEFYCYLLVAALGAWLAPRRASVIVAAAGALGVVSAALYPAAGFPFNLGPFTRLIGEVPAEWPRLAAHFLAGAAFFLLRDRIPHRAWIAAAALGLLVASTYRPPFMLIVNPLADTYLVLWLAFHPRLRAHHFGKYGDFSYGVYLYGFPIQQLLVYLGLSKTVWQNIAMAVPLAVVAGVLSWHLCEKRFLHYRVSGRRPDVLESRDGVLAKQDA